MGVPGHFLLLCTRDGIIVLMEELIYKYLTSQLTDHEKQRLQIWLRQAKSNRIVFENIVADWKLKQSDIDQAKIRIQQRINRKKSTRRKFPEIFLKVAASVFIVGAIALLIHQNISNNSLDQAVAPISMIEKHALPGQKLTFILPDSTVAKLNAGSKLIVPEQFTGDLREVYLEGEAFFEVKEDVFHPFLIKTDKISVRVLGTSFNVRSYNSEDDASVAVVTGRVGIEAETNKRNLTDLVLKPNQMLVYSAANREFQEIQSYNTDEILGWKENKLIFNDDKIDDIFEVLSRWYGVEFLINLELDPGKEFTAKFNNPSLREVMESISYNFKFEYEIIKNKVHIR